MISAPLKRYQILPISILGTILSVAPGGFAQVFFSAQRGLGGDRDGNPNVNADTMTQALSRQSNTILEFYLEEVHALGAELSISTLLVAVSPELQAMADASPDSSLHRTDEPYRRALTGMYARLAATLTELSGGEAARHAQPRHRVVRWAWRGGRAQRRSGQFQDAVDGQRAASTG